MLFSGTAYFSHSVAWHVSASKVSNGCRDFFAPTAHWKSSFFANRKKWYTFHRPYSVCQSDFRSFGYISKCTFASFLFHQKSIWVVYGFATPSQQPSGKKLEPRLVSVCVQKGQFHLFCLAWCHNDTLMLLSLCPLTLSQRNWQVCLMGTNIPIKMNEKGSSLPSPYRPFLIEKSCPSRTSNWRQVLHTTTKSSFNSSGWYQAGGVASLLRFMIIKSQYSKYHIFIQKKWLIAIKILFWRDTFLLPLHHSQKRV